MPHSSLNQSKRKVNGTAAEEFVNKFYRGRIARDDCYDIESKNFLVEVKSCLAYNGKKKCFSFGRFVIKVDNHIGLFLLAKKKNKIPIYVFIVNVGKHRVMVKKKWEEVKVDNNKVHHLIAWPKIVPVEY